jgi:acyl-CoA reductase-like NAD-dependent aldehyde dehydrogenase
MAKAKAKITKRPKARGTRKSSPKLQAAREVCVNQSKKTAGAKKMARAIPVLIAGREAYPEKTFPVLDKYTGDAFEEVSIAGPVEVEQALEVAAGAKDEMAAMPAHKRAEIIKRAAGILWERRESLTKLIAREAGKPYRYAKAEAERTVENLEYCAEEAKRIHGETIPVDAGKSGEGRWGFYERFPIGVVAAISPFNFPLNLAAHKLGPAVAAGCPVILKPASATPLSGLELGKAFIEAGLPEGALSVLPGPGGEIGDLLVGDPRVSKVSFTGSRTVGEGIIRKAGMKRVTLELGGNSAVVIDEDIGSLDYIVKRCTLGAFYNQGQVCISVQRIYVHQKHYDEFLGRLVESAKKLKIGNPVEPDTDIGPMISEAEAQRVQSWVQEAVDQGARVICGHQRQGAIYPPTVVIKARPDMKIVKDEIFGPATVVFPVESFEEGVRLADDSQYGLQSGIFTTNIDRALAAVRKLNVGGVMINDFPSYRIDHMPYGGNKGSGLGREGARFAIEEMTAIRAVIVNLIRN